MKKLFIIAVSIFAFQFSNAQEEAPTFEKNQFSVQYNLHNFTKDDFKFSNDFTFGYQRNLTSEVSVGVNLNYNQIKGRAMEINNNNYFISNEENFRSLGLAFTFNYDWSKIIGLNTQKFDLYTGASLGVSLLDNYSLERSPLNGQPMGWSKYSNNEYFLGSHVGFRYWITKNVGISTEINNSFYNSFHQKETKFNVGLNYKF